MCARVLISVRGVRTSCCRHLQASEETAERRVPPTHTHTHTHTRTHTHTQCCRVSVLVYQVKLSSVRPDCKAMHINSAGGDAARFANRNPARTHTHTHTHTHLLPVLMGELSVVLKQNSARCRLQSSLLQDATHPGPLPPLPLGAAHTPSPGPST